MGWRLAWLWCRGACECGDCCVRRHGGERCTQGHVPHHRTRKHRARGALRRPQGLGADAVWCMAHDMPEGAVLWARRPDCHTATCAMVVALRHLPWAGMPARTGWPAGCRQGSSPHARSRTGCQAALQADTCAPHQHLPTRGDCPTRVASGHACQPAHHHHHARQWAPGLHGTQAEGHHPSHPPRHRRRCRAAGASRTGRSCSCIGSPASWLLLVRPCPCQIIIRVAAAPSCAPASRRARARRCRLDCPSRGMQPRPRSGDKYSSWAASPHQADSAVEDW